MLRFPNVVSYVIRCPDTYHLALLKPYSIWSRYVIVFLMYCSAGFCMLLFYLELLQGNSEVRLAVVFLLFEWILVWLLELYSLHKKQKRTKLEMFLLFLRPGLGRNRSLIHPLKIWLNSRGPTSASWWPWGSWGHRWFYTSLDGPADQVRWGWPMVQRCRLWVPRVIPSLLPSRVSMPGTLVWLIGQVCGSWGKA